MYNEFDKDRLKQIRTMLMEFGSGNFEYRPERTDLNDEIEALTILLNMTVEETKASFFLQGHVNQNKIYNHLVKMFFILDEEDNIMAFNVGAKQMLLFDHHELKRKPFYSFLTDESKLDWDRLKSRLVQKGRTPHDEFIMLSLMNKQDSILTMNCLVDKVLGDIGLSERIMVTSVEIVKDNEKRELRKKITVRQNKDSTDKYHPRAKYKKGLINLRSADIENIRKVCEYMEGNLDKPLPSLKKLAESIGTNEHRLKHGFKQLYGQTAHSFFQSARLDRAIFLIKTSKLPIKTITETTGFPYPSNFSKAFKKKYGHAPSDLRKLFHDDTTLTEKV